MNTLGFIYGAVSVSSYILQELSLPNSYTGAVTRYPITFFLNALPVHIPACSEVTLSDIK